MSENLTLESKDSSPTARGGLDAVSVVLVVMATELVEGASVVVRGAGGATSDLAFPVGSL